jgi:hypothetical protein
MIKLSIVPADTKEATEAAHGRHDFGEAHGYKNHIEQGRKQDVDAEVVGCLGELLCAHYFQLQFNPSVGVIDAVDCKIFEVRTRRIESGKDLALKQRDKMRLPFVLVWINRDRTEATLVGWLCGWEGHQRAKQAKEAGRDLWQPSVRAWFIPPPYHSIASLEDWIGAGHPLHWAPEDYRGVA